MIMKRIYYPGLFIPTNDVIWVKIPDFPECYTIGQNWDEAYQMAMDALGLAIIERNKMGQALPVPTPLDEFEPQEGIVAILYFDIFEYLEKNPSNSVKKHVSLPGWLYEEATRQRLSLSKVLQEALVEKLYNMVPYEVSKYRITDAVNPLYFDNLPPS